MKGLIKMLEEVHNKESYEKILYRMNHTLALDRR